MRIINIYIFTITITFITEWYHFEQVQTSEISCLRIFKQPVPCSAYTNIVFIITQGFRELVVQRLKLIQNLKTVFGSAVYPQKKTDSIL